MSSASDDSYVITSSEEEEDAPISEVESLRLAMEASLQIVEDESTPETKTTQQQDGSIVIWACLNTRHTRTIVHLENMRNISLLT